MPVFKDYNDVADRLVLPVGGKEYTVRGMTYNGRVRWDAAQAGEGEPLTDDEWDEIFLGDLIDELRADNVPAAAIDRARMAAFADAQYGRTAAEMMWVTGGDEAAVKTYLREHSPATKTHKPKTGKAVKADG